MYNACNKRNMSWLWVEFDSSIPPINEGQPDNISLKDDYTALPLGGWSYSCLFCEQWTLENIYLPHDSVDFSKGLNESMCVICIWEEWKRV